MMLLTQKKRKQHYMKNNDTPLPSESVFYYKLKNGDEIISVEEPVGFYKNNLLLSVESADDMTKEDKKQLISDLKKEIRQQTREFSPKNYIELHYPMRVASLPMGGGHGALHMNFWVSPSINHSQIMHLNKSEILIRLSVDENITSYYFSMIRRYILMYAKSLINDGHEFSSKGKDLIAEMEEQYQQHQHDYDSENDFSKESQEENHLPHVSLGNGLKKTLH